MSKNIKRRWKGLFRAYFVYLEKYIGGQKMKTRTKIFLFLLVMLSCVHLFALTDADEIRTIKAVIQEAYIGGAYNDDDTKAIKKGFHNNFTIQYLDHDQRLGVYSLKQWMLQLDQLKQRRPNWNNRTTAEITVIGLKGNVAVVKVDIYNNKVHDLTDFLSLYRLKDGWKITNRIFTRHAPPAEVLRKRVAEWEKKINEELQPPDKVMDVIGVKPGMIIGEIGAGNGRYTVHLARRVGDNGKIYANDINDNALSFIRERCKQINIFNVETILGKLNNPNFPKQTMDMVTMIWVYHHLDYPPITLLKNVKSSLKPGAQLIIIDPTDSEVNIEREAFGIEIDSNRPTSIIERIKKEAGEAGFDLIRVETFLPKDYIFILRAKNTQ